TKAWSPQGRRWFGLTPSRTGGLPSGTWSTARASSRCRFAAWRNRAVGWQGAWRMLDRRVLGTWLALLAQSGGPEHGGGYGLSRRPPAGPYGGRCQWRHQLAGSLEFFPPEA